MRRRIWLAAFVACFALPAGAGAVLGGQPDTGHPYVALVAEGQTACSGALLSSRVLLTAAHCFAADAGGAPLTVRVYFGPAPTPGVGFYTGTFYYDPEFATNGNGLPSADTHDVALVIFSAPIPTSVTDDYAVLPRQGLVDTLSNHTPVDLVGYGVQDFARGGGRPQPAGAFTRSLGGTTLIASDDRIGSEFLKLQNGACSGDSGGPDLLGGTNVVLAVNSFVNNNVCGGNTYSYRVDTSQALSWIAATSSRFAT